MAENSKIEWTTHTFNPWIGCARVSPACEHCYAESMSKRRGWASWGVASAGGTRRVKADSGWGEPLKWQREARATATRARVFCASLADVFEDYAGLDAVRHQRLWPLIESTPNLDWLLLTKRPQNIGRMIPSSWRQAMPANVWLGSTVEDQRRADERIPHLLQHAASVRFLSVEPQLGAIDLSAYIHGIDWVINGGESGASSRPMAIEWARSIREQVTSAGVAYFFKQWGNHAQVGGSDQLVRLRTKNERTLDGREWDEIPKPHASRTVEVPARATAWDHLMIDEAVNVACLAPQFNPPCHSVAGATCQ